MSEGIMIMFGHKITLIRMVVFASVLLVGVTEADSAPSKEYQVKAAFIYNFIKFVDWPEPSIDTSDKEDAESKEPITIGIIGENPFGSAFEAITKKKIRDRRVAIKYFGGFAKSNDRHKEDGRTKYKYEDADALKTCQVLFISASENKYYKEIIDIVKDNCVLTIGETEAFLESGGIVGFVSEERKVKFEINLIAAENTELKVRSKLLRLAKRVIQKEEETS